MNFQTTPSQILGGPMFGFRCPLWYALKVFHILHECLCLRVSISLYIYIYICVRLFFYCHTNKAINYGAGHRVSPYSRKNGSDNDATNMKSGASQGNALWMLSPMMQLSIYIIKLHTNPHPEKNKNYEISLRGPGASENPVPLCMGR